jgi:GNAT superfamily N-acetyltransferase
MRIDVERYADVLEEIKPLNRLQWEEIATFREDVPLDPDYEGYRRHDAAGTMIIVTARSGEELVGYSIFFLLKHPHYRGTWFAMNDIIYVRKDKRGSMAGVALIKRSEREVWKAIEKRGAKLAKVSWHLKPSHDFSALLERLGYVRDEFTMAKILKE